MKIVKCSLSSIPYFLLILVLFGFITIGLTPELFAANEVEVRDDGLTVIMTDSIVKDSKEAQANDYLMMLLKTGSAHDPDNKYGVSVLTGEILSYIFRYTSAVVQYETYPEYTLYLFKVSHNHFQDFCKELDGIVRLDALLFNDLCDELILLHKNEPKPPAATAGVGLTEMLYGTDHPYYKSLQTQFQNLNINDVNAWFRKVYQPKNMIIASTGKLPDDFLRRPSGREMKDQVMLPKVPLISGPNSPDIRFQAIHDNVSTVEIGFSVPLMGEKGFFATQLMKIFLAKDLWDQLRETAGLCYDVRVGYTFLIEPSAPAIQITFQTLPAETDHAIRIVLERLKLLAQNGINKDKLNEIIEKEKRNMVFRMNYPLSAVTRAGLGALYNQAWLTDDQIYIEQLTKSADTIPGTLTEEIAGLKISVAGPEGTVIDVARLKKELDFGRKNEK